jgi:hypothetical protein
MNEMSSPSSPDPEPTTEAPLTEAQIAETTEAPGYEVPTTEAPTTEYGTMVEPVVAPTIAPEAPVVEPLPTPDAVVRRGIRMRTVVFGLVLLAIAGSVLIGQLTDITVDAGVVVLAVMIGSGVLLIAGARRSSIGQ